MLQVIYVIINNLVHKLFILVKVLLLVVCLLFIGFYLWISKWLQMCHCRCMCTTEAGQSAYIPRGCN